MVSITLLSTGENAILTSSHIDHTRKSLESRGERTLRVVSALHNNDLKRYSSTVVHRGRRCSLVAYSLDGDNLPSASIISMPPSRLESRKKSSEPTETYQSTQYKLPELPSFAAARSERIKSVIEALGIELGILDVHILLSNIVDVFGSKLGNVEPLAECPQALLTWCVVFDSTLLEHCLTSCDKSATGSVNSAGTHIPSSLSPQEGERTKTMGETKSLFVESSSTTRLSTFSTLTDALGPGDHFGNRVQHQLQSQSASIPSHMSNYGNQLQADPMTISYDGVMHHSSFDCPIQVPTGTAQSARESSIAVGQDLDDSMLLNCPNQLYNVLPHARDDSSTINHIYCPISFNDIALLDFNFHTHNALPQVSTTSSREYSSLPDHLLSSKQGNWLPFHGINPPSHHCDPFPQVYTASSLQYQSQPPRTHGHWAISADPVEVSIASSSQSSFLAGPNNSPLQVDHSYPPSHVNGTSYQLDVVNGCWDTY